VIPAGVTQLSIERWGGGSAASMYRTATDIILAAGSGGGYVRKLLTVVPGTTMNYVVGAGGVTSAAVLPIKQGGDGVDTEFGPSLVARGGTASTFAAGTPNIIGNAAGGGGFFHDFLFFGGDGDTELLPYIGPTLQDYTLGSASSGAAFGGSRGVAQGGDINNNIVAASTVGYGTGGACGVAESPTSGGQLLNTGSGNSGVIIITYFIP
jgi:hypothetical protein